MPLPVTSHHHQSPFPIASDCSPLPVTSHHRHHQSRFTITSNLSPSPVTFHHRHHQSRFTITNNLSTSPVTVCHQQSPFTTYSHFSQVTVTFHNYQSPFAITIQSVQLSTSVLRQDPSNALCKVNKAGYTAIRCVLAVIDSIFGQKQHFYMVSTCV